MDALVGTHLLAHARLPVVLDKPMGNKALAIVETRPSFFLPHVVASAVRTHPGWRLYVFGTPEVHALLNSACANYEQATRVTLESAHMSPHEYSQLLVSEAFWSVISEEHILLFQADCVLVRPTPPDMLVYDYVGAVCGTLHPDRFVMNGGLSVRRRSAMLRALSLMTAESKRKPEDVAFCETMRAAGTFCLPSMEACNAFAIESMGDPDRAVGMHGTDKYYAPRGLVARLLASAPSPRPPAPAQT